MGTIGSLVALQKQLGKHLGVLAYLELWVSGLPEWRVLRRRATTAHASVCRVINMYHTASVGIFFSFSFPFWLELRWLESVVCRMSSSITSGQPRPACHAIVKLQEESKDTCTQAAPLLTGVRLNHGQWKDNLALWVSRDEVCCKISGK